MAAFAVAMASLLGTDSIIFPSASLPRNNVDQATSNEKTFLF